jgi:hypothetical protein
MNPAERATGASQRNTQILEFGAQRQRSMAPFEAVYLR